MTSLDFLFVTQLFIIKARIQFGEQITSIGHISIRGHFDCDVTAIVRILYSFYANFNIFKRWLHYKLYLYNSGADLLLFLKNVVIFNGPRYISVYVQCALFDILLHVHI